MLNKIRNPDFSGNTTTTEITVKRYYDRYNKQLKKERTLTIVKGFMTAIALVVTIVCLFLMMKVR